MAKSKSPQRNRDEEEEEKKGHSDLRGKKEKKRSKSEAPERKLEGIRSVKYSSKFSKNLSALFKLIASNSKEVNFEEKIVKEIHNFTYYANAEDDPVFDILSRFENNESLVKDSKFSQSFCNYLFFYIYLDMPQTLQIFSKRMKDLELLVK